jgi:hypothetical protein
MSFEDVCETSPKMWKTLNFMVDCYTVQKDDTARAPVAGKRTSESQSPDPLSGRSAAMPVVAVGWRLTSSGRCRCVLMTAGRCGEVFVGGDALTCVATPQAPAVGFHLGTRSETLINHCVKR